MGRWQSFLPSEPANGRPPKRSRSRTLSLRQRLSRQNAANNHKCSNKATRNNNWTVSETRPIGVAVLVIENKFLGTAFTVAQRAPNASERGRIGQRPEKQLDSRLAPQLFLSIAAVLFQRLIHPKDPPLRVSNRHPFRSSREQRRDDLT